MYKVDFLPIAFNDLKEITRYISIEKNNPVAAEKLVSEILNAADSLEESPYRCPQYIPIERLQKEYRKMFVKRYILFYWVDEDTKTVTIARIVFSRRDYQDIVK